MCFRHDTTLLGIFDRDDANELADKKAKWGWLIMRKKSKRPQRIIPCLLAVVYCTRTGTAISGQAAVMIVLRTWQSNLT
jgi:hypothetical protein